MNSTDHRGKPAHVRTPNEAPTPDGVPPPPIAPADRRAYEKMRIESIKQSTLGCTVCVFALIILCYLGAAWMLPGGGAAVRARPWTVALLIAVCIGMVLWLLLRLDRPSPPGAVWFWLRRGMCPSCGYALRDLQEEPDGCTMCPECGAAWHLRRERPEGGGT